MTGLEYMRTVCPTTKVGKEPLREDIIDAFEDGIAEGWKQCKEKQWKPSERELGAILAAVGDERQKGSDVAKELLNVYQQLKAL